MRRRLSQVTIWNTSQPEEIAAIVAMRAVSPASGASPANAKSGPNTQIRTARIRRPRTDNVQRLKTR